MVLNDAFKYAYERRGKSKNNDIINKIESEPYRLPNDFLNI